MSVNMVILVGHLGKDPEVRFTQGGTAVCNFSMATSEQWESNGQKQERTEWHNIVVWGKMGEACGKHLAKGRQVYVQGRIQTEKWQDKDGNDRYTTKVVAQRVQFLGGRGEGGGGQQQERSADPWSPPGGNPYPSPPEDDDIPF